MEGSLWQHILSFFQSFTVTDSILLSLLRDFRSANGPDEGPILTAIDGLIDAVVCREPPTKITEREVSTLCASLRELGYGPTTTQLVKVLRGSRSIADDRLRGLPEYRRYRGVMTAAELATALRPFEQLITGNTLKAKLKTTAKAAKPWRDIDFFTTEAFDKLTEGKAADLFREVQALGVRKPTDRLPAYMARARRNLPRSFEPWTRAERALLIEAMCYTNDGGKLASIFGRSDSAVREEGKRLIWDSKQKNKVA